MKIPILVLLLIASTDASEVLIHRTHNRHHGEVDFQKFAFHVDSSALVAAGSWEPGTGVAPAVNRNQAAKLALQASGKATSKVLVTLQNVNEWEVGENTLPAETSEWFYVVEIMDAPKPSLERFVVVTVGGAVAKAVVED